ncbi:MAG: N-methyl-L-tryptophan oxidase [Gemmatimonadaceae bacterium]|nr:N-methyl-L-tryptophan oxidase [Gemmatimonadaceae bacterium]
MADAPYDVVIAGLGAMGSSAALHLARRGVRVLALDRYAPPHDHGSSHGKTRLIREAYFEAPLYVPLVRRAYELWHQLSAEIGSPLIQPCGALMIGTPDSAVIAGTLESARHHAVPHERLDAQEIHRRFPPFTPLDDMIGVHEPGAGLLEPERVIALHLELATRSGAALMYGCRLERWESADGGVTIYTDQGSFSAHQLVLACGAWVPGLLPQLPLEVERQVLHWWIPARTPEAFRADRMPASLWSLHDGTMFYTMPDTGHGLKTGWHHHGERADPDAVDRTVSRAEHAAMTDLLRRFVPAGKGTRRESQVCLYTNTPDQHFLIDRLPGEPRVLAVSACSGHGFKFSSVIGEVVADLVTTGMCAFDLSPFRLSRFGRQPIDA